MIETISPADVSALLSMIDPSWAARVPVVQAIAAIEGGDWWSAPDVADLTGRTPGRCRQLLAELAEARVILRDGGPGGRRFWCEVNPDWRSWAVPWRHPRRVVRQKLADIRERRSISALHRFIASPMSSRCAEINASLIARDKAQQEAVEAALSRVHGARDNAPAPTPYREPRPRGKGGAYREPHGLAINGPPGEKKKNYSPRGSSRDVENSSSQAPEAPTTAPTPAPAIDPKDRARARQAVKSRCLGAGGREPYLAGEPARRLDALLAIAGVDELLIGVEKLEAGVHMPKSFVEHLADVVLAGDQIPLPLEEIETPGQARLTLIGRLEGVRQQMANYEANDYEIPEDLRDEEAEILTALGGEP
ncbi:MAG TPA: hypothetical protein VJ931_09135 [Actinomycetota bacterium]|nr:hypothetical protein [Actinomycetota bacterium]